MAKKTDQPKQSKPAKVKPAKVKPVKVSPAKKESPDDPISVGRRILLFLSVHWRGVFVVIWPLIWSFMLFPLPGELYMWVAFTLVTMGAFWVTECIPLAVTSFIPIVIFPLRGVSSSLVVTKIYVNDTIMMFLGSLFLANCVEQSGLHKRLAYFAIRKIGYSHVKLLLAMCTVTTFCSMWITNTAATTMMTPINFALLRVFEEEKVLKIFVSNSDGDQYASDFTTCYFCAATFSATIGGIGTLVGTGTNLVFKGLFAEEFAKAPEYLSFPLFSAFAVPYMILMEICVYLWMIIFYFGVFRKNSATARKAIISEAAKESAKATIKEATVKLGKIYFWEIATVVLFGGAMFLFFSRSPQLFTGWGDMIRDFFLIDPKIKFCKDSSLAMLVSFLMFMIPYKLCFFKHFTAKYVEDMPKEKLRGVLDWTLLNKAMPYSFMFLCGGGFTLSNAAKSSGLNAKIGEIMATLEVLPNEVVIFLIITVVIFTTNFASNIAVANVFVPISMNLALRLGYNPLWYTMVAGFSASFCFLLPVGTPGNLIVQSAAKVATPKMMVAGSVPSLTTIVITWFAFYLWAPIIWPVLHQQPSWIKDK